MKANIRRWVASLIVTSSAFVDTVAAQVYPSKPLRWIMPFAAGGTGDLVLRTLSGPLTKSLGQNLIVDNRPGASTIIGTELAARAPADGYTLLYVSNPFTTNPAVRRKLPYDTLNDFAGVARIITSPFVIAIHPSVPAKTLNELLSLARTRPGELTYGTGAVGGSQHLAMELLSESAKVKFNHVPYQGVAPMTLAAVGGHLSIAVTNVPDAVPYVATGKLRPVAVTSRSRSSVLEDVPTVAEVGFPGYEFELWHGVVAARATPRDAINRLSAEIARALEQGEVKKGLGMLGFVLAPLSAEQFDAFVRADIQRNEKIARQANIRID